ncbi:hypothetical protein Dcar01_02381 [Deinococcus carri]|uniref:Uncharacterized protein n=1 Tax=Deinococcus carri TaxID=1211323 RepID=A0ABP9WBP5_9DEIO
MKKSLLSLTALLLGGAFAVRGEKFSMSMPHWIADYHSLTYHGAGAPLNWGAFTDPKYGATGRRRIPSGTAVSVVDNKIVPADGAADTLLLFSDAQEGLASDSPSGYGLVVSGNVYEDRLPDATGMPARLPVAIRGKATRFYLQAFTPTYLE